MTVLTLAALSLTPGGAAPTDVTAALAASPLGSNTGIKYVNTGREMVLVQTNATSGGTTVTSDIGTTVQGQAVPGVEPPAPQPASKIFAYGPYPSQYDKQDGTNQVEIDFGTPANVSAVLVITIPGVV